MKNEGTNQGPEFSQNDEIKTGMTSDEIDEHLNTFKSEEGKMGYLNEVLNHDGMLSPETRDQIYLKLYEAHMKELDLEEAEKVADKMTGDRRQAGLAGVLEWYTASRKQNFSKAEKVAEKMGRDGIEYLLVRYIDHGKFSEAERLADMMGPDGNKMKIKIVESALKLSYLKEAEPIIRVLPRNDEETQRLAQELLKRYLEKQDWSGAETMAVLFGTPNDEMLAEIYEHTGKAMKAKLLRNRLESQTSK